MKCFACGAEKDLTVKAVYPYEGDCLTTEVPIPQLLTLPCAPNERGSGFRMAVLCHECWHLMEMDDALDLWLGQEYWDSFGSNGGRAPAIPFERLPFELPYDPENRSHEKAENYSEVGDIFQDLTLTTRSSVTP